MVKGKIWGEFNGEYHEIEIEECDVIVAIGMKVPDEDGAIGTQAASLGYGLTIGDFVTSVAGGAAQVVLDTGDPPEAKKAVLCLLADEINRLTKKSRPSLDEYLKMILREVED